MEAETLSDTLANVRTEPLFHALAYTEAEVKTEALCLLKPYAEVDTLKKVEAVALVYKKEHKFSQE